MPSSFLNQAKDELIDHKEMEILKFKMIAFVKTYQSEFNKMKMQISQLK